jgi:hypothetical protein
MASLSGPRSGPDTVNDSVLNPLLAEYASSHKEEGGVRESRVPISVSLCDLEIRLRSSAGLLGKSWLKGPTPPVQGVNTDTNRTLVHKINSTIQGGTMFAILGGSGKSFLKFNNTLPPPYCYHVSEYN